MNNIFDYTLASLWRHGSKNILIMFVFGFLVWLLASVIFITSSLTYEYKKISINFPDILVQLNYNSNKKVLNQKDLDLFWSVPGVSMVQGRVWGQYYFDREKVYLSIFGVNPYEEHYQQEISKIAETFPESENKVFMMTSRSIANLLQTYTKQFGTVPFYRPDGSLIQAEIKGIFKLNSSLENNDIILLQSDIAREILGLKKDEFTDILLNIPNPNEVDLISTKLKYTYPYLNFTTKNEIIKDYQILFDYKSGWFLMMLLSSFICFCIILYDKASGLRSEEKKEIAILKALGWEVNHIINYKLSEALILSLFAFSVGIILAIFFVYFLQAPGLKYVFTGFSSLKQPFILPFIFNLKLLALLFFATIPLYIAVCIIPSWKVATKEVGEIIR